MHVNTTSEFEKIWTDVNTMETIPKDKNNNPKIVRTKMSKIVRINLSIFKTPYH